MHRHARLLGCALIPGLLFATLAAAAPAASVKQVGARSWRVTLTAPVQHDLSIARLDFRLGRRARRSSAKPLTIVPVNGLGLNYAAGGRLLEGVPSGVLSAVIVATNRRPTGSLAPDLGALAFTVGGARLTREPVVNELVNAYARRPAPGAPVPLLAPIACAGVGAQTADTTVKALYSSGAFFTFTASEVLAQALDVACGQPSDPAFDQDVTQPGAPGCAPCGPGTYPCCAPKPGFACPLAQTRRAMFCPQPA